MKLRRALLCILVCLAPLSAQDVRHLTILHSNDLHAHLLPDDQGRGGFAYLATAVRQERSHCAACLYLNAGDLVEGTPVSTIYHGDPIYQVSNLLNFDASVTGNHEFDYGYQAIPRFARIAHYPLLVANILDIQNRPLTNKPYIIETIGGIRVGIIGVVLGDLDKDYSTPELLGPIKILPVVETVRRYARELQDRADLIVVLGHIHDSEADAILREVPEVQVAIIGHNHIGYTAMHTINGHVGVLVTGYGLELGRLDLDLDLQTKKLDSVQWKKIPIDSKSLQPAPDVAKEVARWEAKVSKIVDIPIGEAKQRLDRDAVRAMVEQAMRDQTGADFAFINAGGIRDALPTGKILARAIWNIMPFEERLVVGTFKGSQLPPSVTRGQTVDPNRDYKLAVTDFTAVNQESSGELNTRGLKFPVKGPLLRDAIIDWVKKKKLID